jgi:RNA polymerase sigma factor (sigma-70 family)
LEGRGARAVPDPDVDEQHNDRADWVKDALRRFAGPLTRYAARLTGDAERARDVVQDTFVRLWAADPARLNGKLAEWLFTVCRRRALDVNRKERRMTTLDEIELDATASADLAPDAQTAQREGQGEALRLLAALPPNQQEVIRLKFQSALSYQEISGVTGLSVSNVGYLIHTGLKTMREKMRESEAQSSKFKIQEKFK